LRSPSAEINAKNVPIVQRSLQLSRRKIQSGFFSLIVSMN